MKACGSHDKQWRDGRQHDAQEYLRSILEAMQVHPGVLNPCTLNSCIVNPSVVILAQQTLAYSILVRSMLHNQILRYLTLLQST